MSSDLCHTTGLMDIDSARRHMLARVRPAPSERIPLADAHDRVLAETVTARSDSPAFDTAMMDGYALRSLDLNDNDTTLLPVSQRIAAGDTPRALAPDSAARIFTGAPVPDGADSVVLQEACSEQDGQVALQAGIEARRNILYRGENFAAGLTLIEAGRRLQPQHLGLAASQGMESLEVYTRLRVALINSGDELVMPGSPLKPGQIYNSNYFTLRALLENCGCRVLDFNILADTPAQSQATLEQAAAEADVVITTGGVSVGEEDHIRDAVAALGELQLWRVRIKPGKPFAFGRIHDTPFIGLPGNPVSCFVTFCLLARPYLLACQGLARVLPQRLVVHADFNTERPDKRDAFRVAILERGEALKAKLVANQNSASLRPLLQGDGLVHIPAFLKVGQGMTLDFYPYSELL